MKLSAIGTLRLAAQHVTTHRDADPAAVVRHLLALQAQDYNGALWSIGLRTTKPAKSAVERAIADREIVRTWPMRGTLHFVHADDAKWLLALAAPRATASAKSRRVTQLGLTDDIVDQAEAMMRHTLKGGHWIKRGDVTPLLADTIKDIAVTGQHVQHLMRNFGERGIICFGPNDGKQPTFVLLDEWVPGGRDLAPGDALIEYAYRYFMSHGPATLKDFAGWGMLTTGDAKAGIEGARSRLESAIIDGTEYLYAPGLTAGPASDALLLPGFDEFLLGYKDRSAVLAPEYSNRIVPGGNGMFLPTVVENGHVTGLWKKIVKASGVVHQYESFQGKIGPTTASEAAYDTFLIT